jgi:2,4-dienoyl-CoA reductase-like NADH-dependent reductase (Old Yellow Enzyme family)
MSFPSLRQPIRIGSMIAPNRIVRSAAGTGLADGEFGPEFIAYHASRARGGVGLLMLGDVSIHPTTATGATGRGVNLWSDDAIPGYERLSAAIHAEGSLVVQSLSHHGSSSTLAEQPWSASALPDRGSGRVARAMTQEMIDEIVAAFAAAAARCAHGGVDGVEVHGGHGFLINQFLSPLTNRRTDDYGNSPANRARFAREVLTAVRTAVGRDFPVGIRVSASERLPGGLEPTQVGEFVAELVAAGLIDFVSVSLGHLGSYPLIIGGMHQPRGYQLSTTSLVTARATVPTIVAGRIDRLDLAEQIVASGTADMVAMLRATIADPDLVAKSFAGRIDEVRPCIACNECFRAVGVDKRVACAVNPELVPTVRPIVAPIRIVVVGAGPAGLEAARTAALAGHEVVVLEARERPGGALALAATAPNRADLGLIVDWYERELARLGVPVRYGSRADPAVVAALAPDVVAVATGARPVRDRRGAGYAHVVTSAEVHAGAGRGASRAVVVDELGSYEAVGVAESLAGRGVDVMIVTQFDGVGDQLGVTLERDPARERLAATGVLVRARATLRSIGSTSVVIGPVDGDGPTETQPADLVVLAVGYESERTLADSLVATGQPTVVVGDALRPGRLAAAIASGHEALVTVNPPEVHSARPQRTLS